MRIYIVSKMICDNKADYHVMEEPRLFASREQARAYVDEDVKMYEKDLGYDVDEVKDWSKDGIPQVTVYFDGGFVEYRIDDFLAEEVK